MGLLGVGQGGYTGNPTRSVRGICARIPGFGVKLVVLHSVTVLIAGGISTLNLVCVPAQ